MKRMKPSDSSMRGLTAALDKLRIKNIAWFVIYAIMPLISLASGVF